MLKASFVTIVAFAAGLAGFTATGASAFPVVIPPLAQTDATSPMVIDVRAGGGHGGGHGGYHGGYHGNYHRPNYNHNHHYNNHWNGNRCRGWTSNCRYYYNGWYYPNVWWTVPFIGAGVAIASSGSYGSRHKQWCADKYRSYNPRTNTWTSNSGKLRQCVSPYAG